MTNKETPSKTAANLYLLIMVCFFLSGMSGLIYEILWTRMVVKIIGGAPFAVSIILTVFMGGLGLGSYLASRTIDSIKEPLRLVRIYGVLELIVGGYGLLLPLLLVVFRPVFAVAYNNLFEQSMLYHFLTFVGCVILFILPVICMGATLPILCRFYVTRLSHLGAHAGRLYGLNTIGAAVGSLLCGFWLIHLLGMWGTLAVAVLVNAAIGLVCLRVGYRERLPQGAPEPQAPSETVVAGPVQVATGGVLGGALFIFAVSGFCAMAYEVIWTRLLGLIVGPTTYSFTIVLVTFILGLAVGSIIFGRLADRSRRPIWLLIGTQIAAGLFALVVSHFLGNSQLFFAKVIYVFQDRFALLSISKAVILFLVMILPTVCLGATFPLVGKIYTQSIKRVGRSIGYAYAINTIGAVLGSFCAGFVLVPLLGKERGLSLVIAVQLLTALVIAGIVYFRKRRQTIRVALLATAAAAGVVFSFYYPTWNRHLYAEGKYHRFVDVSTDMAGYGWLETLLEGPEILNRLEQGELMYYGDGIGGFTTVTKYTYGLGDVMYSMANSGKPDASTRTDMTTQTLLAHFPLIFHPQPKSVMALGLGSGITACEALCYPLERLDVVDINKQVAEASDLFIPWNYEVLTNPRTNLIIQDGRAHLGLTDRKYDVVTSEPSSTWMAGMATLFTRDFFTYVHDRLNDDGIFAQFIFSYQMDWATFALIGRTFADVFPNSLLVATWPSTKGPDYLLIGFKGENGPVLENARRNLQYARQSKNIRLARPELLYRLVLAEDLKVLFGDGPINTDSRPRLEFTAPKLMYVADPAISENIRSYGWLSDETRQITEAVTKDVDAQLEFAEYAVSLYAPFPGMVDLERATPEQRERFVSLMDDYFAKNSEDFSQFGDGEMRARWRNIQTDVLLGHMNSMPDKGLSYAYLAALYLKANDLEEAVKYYYKAVEFDPDAESYTNLAVALIRQGKPHQAIHQLNEALHLRPYFADAHRNMGCALALTGKLDEAVGHFEEGLHTAPNDAQALHDLGLALAQQGKFDEAVARFYQSLQIWPDNPNAHCNAGIVLTRQGRLDEATAHFNEALRLAPEHPQALQALQAIQSMQEQGR